MKPLFHAGNADSRPQAYHHTQTTYQTTLTIYSQSLGKVEVGLGLIRLTLRDGRFHETYKMREKRSLPGEYGKQMRSVRFHGLT